MHVAVLPTEDAEHGALVEVGPPYAVMDDVLVHRVHLGAGVYLDVDLMAPCHWRRLTFPLGSEGAAPVLTRLLGQSAADGLGDGDIGPIGGSDGTVAVDIAGAGPWLRVAVVDAVDQWVHLTLDQSLLDAERAVSRMRAAVGLPDGPARSAVMSESLLLARRASGGLVRFLQAVDATVAPALRAALRTLVDGYAALTNEVVGEDHALDAVVAAGEHLTADLTRRTVTRRFELPAATAVRAAPGAGASMIDPRQSRARTFAISPDPTLAEVSVTSGGQIDAGTVAVRAAAFGARVAPEMLSRLMVRLVERNSGRIGGHALLSPGRRSRGRAVFEARVPLVGIDPNQVRADLFDVFVVREPASDDDDAGLRRARKAVTLLSGWRQLCGLVLMPVRPAEIAPLLRDAVVGLRDGADGPEGDPVCNGAPSLRNLHRFASMDDEPLLEWLRASARPGGPDAAHDSGGLTVAELAVADATLAK
ncbi:hypothetical protein [Pseudonocardia endophytica]|uniref:Uncharacterized protein n=1 Tax=Pseudonocardia endophytica TaxID=401976 RepID=A0A4V6NDE6_PSEEN|nr:hypothetical protein [Pseudonocardia endophytica]TCK21386.1 hypothetical protein EV378_5369 [Pseudonocardia endophytica]